MQSADIPSQILKEVYQAIADRHETEPDKVDRTKVSEDEFMAALAFTHGAPLIEAGDINESLLACCRALSRDLDPDALMDYKFVPLAKPGQALVAISSCPWDPMTTEIISSYFLHCSRVRFVLISPKNLTEIFHRLKAASPKDGPVAGYTPKPAPPMPRPVIPQPAPQVATQPLSAKPGPAPAVAPTAQTATARLQPSPASAPSGPEIPEIPAQCLLTPEEVACLINVFVQEANRLLQHRQRK